jgi:hypothetical protein
MTTSQVRWTVPLVLLLLAGYAPAEARQAGDPLKGIQQPEPEPEEIEAEPEPEAEPDAAEENADRPGRFLAQIETWIAQPSGLQYVPATFNDPTDPFSTDVAGMKHGTSAESRGVLGYDFKDDIGRFTLAFYSHADRAGFSATDPSLFVLGESLVHPAFAGVFDDGTADGAVAGAITEIRDLRLDFSREAFSTRRVSARWLVGIRRVTHVRDFGASYFALAANLPPLQPPLTGTRPDLDPLADVASSRSEFEGRGPEFGLELILPVMKRLRVETGFTGAILRGKIESQYSSRTHFYALTSGDVVIGVVGPPFAEFEETDPLGAPLVNAIRQVSLPYHGRIESTPASAQVLEGYLGLRLAVWRQVEVYGGFRSARYDDVGMDLRPVVSAPEVIGKSLAFVTGQTTPYVSGVRVEGVSQTPRSVTYEGFYLGAGFRF